MTKQRDKTAQRLPGLLRYINFGTVFIALIISIPLHWTMLRLNSQTMIDLREAVVAIDDQSNGDLAAIEPALIELQDYITHHMGTAMGSPLILQYRYNRLFDEAMASFANSESSYRRSVYEAATIRCQDADAAVNDRVICMQQFIISQPGISPSEIAQLPPIEQFSYDFIPPGWSSDLAGFSLLICIMLGSTALVLLITEIALPRLIKSYREDPQ